MTYASLTEVYHCPICSHPFTLSPPLAPPPSHLLPLSYDPFPTPVSRVELTWSASDVAAYFRQIPGLVPLAKRVETLGIDGKRLLEMAVYDFIDELGLWGAGPGGGGGRLVANAAAVVKLMEVQGNLRGEKMTEAEAQRLGETLIGMQRMAGGVQGGKGSGKGLFGQSPAPVRYARRQLGETALQAGTGVMAMQVGGMAAGHVAGAGGVVRVKKQYRLPVVAMGRVPVGAVAAFEVVGAEAVEGVRRSGSGVKAEQEVVAAQMAMQVEAGGESVKAEDAAATIAGDGTEPMQTEAAL